MQLDGFGAPLEQQQQGGGEIHFAIPGKVPRAVTVGADPIRINQQAAQVFHHAEGDFLYEAGEAFINFNLLLKSSLLRTEKQGQIHVPMVSNIPATP
jgi:hypothetical protein